MVAEDNDSPMASGSGNASPFVHPDRQMSIVNTSTPAEEPKLSEGGATDASADNAKAEGPSGGEPAAKRQRTLGTEEKKRGQRLFDNLLGTLNRFTKEEKSKAASDRAKARQEVAARVASKLQGESKRVHEINEYEREVKSARIDCEKVQNTLREAEMEARTKARHLPYVSGFLLTGSSWVDKSDGALIMALGPPREAAMAANPKPLYYRPRKLLPEQEDILDDQEKKAREMVKQNEVALIQLREETQEKLAALTEKRRNAQEKLDGFRRKEEDQKIENLAKSMDVDQGTAPSITIKGESDGKPVEMSAEDKSADVKGKIEKVEPAKVEADVEMDADDAGRGGREGDEVEY